MITLITGGARSGKSSFAQREAMKLSPNPVYVATAKLYKDDKEFAARVERHKEERDERWTSYEEQMNVSKLPLENRVVVIDCVTLWLTNFFSLYKMNIDDCLQAIKQEIDLLHKMDGVFFIISNEIGMGVHAGTETGRRFTDLQGWANQYIAEKADKVILMVSGIAVTIKQKDHVL